ncbi:MAG: phosphoglycerate kinase [Mailhella sp.]|nr:phosphoglycerate kinase [Mailhella sp.]
MKALSMDDVDLQNKRVVIRCDLNVPLKNGVIKGDKRIRAVIPTIRKALDKNCAVIILSHLGRPTEGVFEEEFSLAPVAKRLGELLGKEVRFHAYDPDLKVEAKNGEAVLLENVRFLTGEKKNNPELGAKFASLGDIYVMDAFGAAHRAHASTESAIRQAKAAVAGPLMLAEMEAANKILQEPKRPLYAIVGGSKVSTKVTVLENLLGFVDGLIVAGGIANTFLLAEGYAVGKSLVEEDFVEEAKRLIKLAKDKNVDLPLAKDVVVAKDLSTAQDLRTCPITDIKADEAIFDMGEETCKEFAKALEKAHTVVWNGPLGVFEQSPFDKGTRLIGDILAKSKAYTLVCGGDSVTAVEQFGIQDKMGYLSTGGGAFLEVLEGKILPSVAALADRA